jgi:hypothetical protein
MNPPPKRSTNQTALFQVYLRLRPPIVTSEDQSQRGERYLLVEPPPPCDDGTTRHEAGSCPTHIILQPPADSRKRAVEKFAFTKVFEEEAQQLDVFEHTGMPSLIDGVLNEGRDGLIATLGVTGSGKVLKNYYNGK